MNTFNVRTGTKVPRIGNAPTHFIANALTLHQPETAGNASRSYSSPVQSVQ
ncbi:hypothetical protein [Bradyrhizobium sp. C9]|uniref:hypothetical protein n=1 Tax=Bradyrhizobium sp. C9 TaxID=142585 RepID=UPI0013047A4F|nr:hypothetical protein [Bradyrhizobium sp. C9]